MVDLTIGYLPTIKAATVPDKHGLAISGAITYAIDQVRHLKLLPDGVNLRLKFNDTRGDLLVSTKATGDMMMDGVVAVFGPENTCNIEATIASAFNKLIISHASFQVAISSTFF